MKTSLFRLRLKSTLLLAVLGILAGTLSQGKAQDAKVQPIGPAQEQPKAAIKDAPKEKEVHGGGMTSLVKAGYTRPTNVSDRVNERGVIVPVTLDPEVKDKLKIVGGTVYFAVYKMPGTGGNFFESEFTSYSDRFVEGRSFQNSYSPSFDTKAKYLYVYQIVNDRGLEKYKDREITQAAFTEDVPTLDIASFSLRLRADPRYITSWGYFQDIGFQTVVPDRNAGGIVAVAADGKTRDIRLAVSADSSIEAALPNPRFMKRSPAYSLGDLMTGWGTGKSTLNLTETAGYQDLAKRKGDPNIKTVNWENNLVKAAGEAKRPDFVQLVYGMDESRLPAEDRIGPTAFQIQFSDKNLLKVGEHSVLYGFTTDLPPVEDNLRIEAAGNGRATGTGGIIGVVDGAAPGTGGGIIGAGIGDGAGAGAGTGAGLGMGMGSGITPAGISEPAAGGGGGGGMGGGLGGMSGGGGGGGIPLAGFAGGLGAARPAASGGGSGSGGGTGSGEGDTNAAQDQAQAAGIKINFNALLNNQQAQFQNQLQLQLQKQNQHQSNGGGHHHHGGHGHVVPEPGTMILGFLGLPALYYYGRRKFAVKMV